MRSYIKGVITGFLIAGAVFAVPAFADMIDAVFNTVNISIEGVEKLGRGEDYELSDGTTTPSSLIYNETTYLPIRKVSELLDKHVYWDGASRTVEITGKQKDIETIAEKPDAEGNMLKYYTFTADDKPYLCIENTENGDERVYPMTGKGTHVTSEAVYFIQTDGYDPKLRKILFDNGVEPENGGSEDIGFTSGISYEFDGHYLFYGGTGPGTGARGLVGVYDIDSGYETRFDNGHWRSVYGIKIIESTGDKTIIEFADSTGTGPTFMATVEYDKKSGEFGEKTIHSIRHDGFYFYADGGSDGRIAAWPPDGSGKVKYSENPGRIINIEVLESDETTVTLGYEYIKNGSEYSDKVVFDKETKTFSKPRSAE